ncbi:MAG: c-type cytochrome [Phycisphaerae bacterium]|nr:c-type cytochrome [Phycisphaerae bacterium]
MSRLTRLSSLLFLMVGGPSLLAAPGAPGMPEARSNHAHFVDWDFNLINLITVIFFTIIIVVMVYFAIKYRRPAGEKAPKTSSHNTGLELAWSLPPLVIVMYLFYRGFVGFAELATPPEDTYDIQVVGQQWNWQFVQPNGFTDPNGNLHIPAGRPVKLVMTSVDVLHSLWIPAFRVKQDVVPQRYSYVWFIADKPTPHADDPAPEGEASTAQAVAHGLVLNCTEFCGDNHSLMNKRVIVHKSDWKPPKVKQSDDPVERGKTLFALKGCIACHSLDATPKLGPSFAGGILGREETLVTGKKITITEAEIRVEISTPQARLIKPPPGKVYPPMPQIPLSPRELDDLVAYLMSLSKGK